jgi:hypothetical protein
MLHLAQREPVVEFGDNAFALFRRVKVPTVPLGVGNGTIGGGVTALLPLSLANDISIPPKSTF